MVTQDIQNRGIVTITTPISTCSTTRKRLPTLSGDGSVQYRGSHSTEAAYAAAVYPLCPAPPPPVTGWRAAPPAHQITPPSLHASCAPGCTATRDALSHRALQHTHKSFGPYCLDLHVSTHTSMLLHHTNRQQVVYTHAPPASLRPSAMRSATICLTLASSSGVRGCPKHWYWKLLSSSLFSAPSCHTRVWIRTAQHAAAQHSTAWSGVQVECRACVCTYSCPPKNTLKNGLNFKGAVSRPAALCCCRVTHYSHPINVTHEEDPQQCLDTRGGQPPSGGVQQRRLGVQHCSTPQQDTAGHSTGVDDKTT